MQGKARSGLPTLTTSWSLRCVVLRSSASVASASASVLSVTELAASGLACTEHSLQVTIHQEILVRASAYLRHYLAIIQLQMSSPQSLHIVRFFRSSPIYSLSLYLQQMLVALLQVCQALLGLRLVGCHVHHQALQRPILRLHKSQPKA